MKSVKFGGLRINYDLFTGNTPIPNEMSILGIQLFRGTSPPGGDPSEIFFIYWELWFLEELIILLLTYPKPTISLITSKLNDLLNKCLKSTCLKFWPVIAGSEIELLTSDFCKKSLFSSTFRMMYHKREVAIKEKKIKKIGGWSIPPP